jgi:GPI ethanolamine phosphate transferase 2/3 subunit F
MAKKKNATIKPKAAGQSPDNQQDGTTSTSGSSQATILFPYAKYTSLLGVHNTLLLFATFFLPQSLPRVEQASSRDRPQNPFLDALTSEPAVTVFVISAGAAVLQSWWAGWIRRWAWGSNAEADKIKVCVLDI